ncbi:hypothetical protein EJ04DRAFT_460374 [Polyplosphaeria fusca]|uniref:RING-type E3 ubiquitin transferase n=1 Tax=Polyplosphaeria fusca TaxID=682080 RepID=A0A9P4R7A0_9PLEO|nr:hypothetical protein EJ04DRAFT_460374 [Polyplosphaeria fusca]
MPFAMTRLQIYVAGSAVLANVVLLRAYYERPNFYSAAVYISQSTGSLMFLINLALIVFASFGYGLQQLFYGPLRPIETEQLYDKAWFAVSETLLAMTIFRNEHGVWFFTMFLFLLAGKVWQWIGEGRVEFLEQQPPANPRLFHTRLASSLVASVGFAVYMTNYCVDSILQDSRPGVMVMFGFEYVLLAIVSFSSLLRYVLSLVEIYIVYRQEKARDEARTIARAQNTQSTDADTSPDTPAVEEDDDDDVDGDVPGWEEKGRWVFYLDLATDFIKSVVYLGFFMILISFYGIPIHIMRDLFMTIRSFVKRVNDFIQYRNATRDMNARYPDATAEELGRENTCIVCREEMRPWVQPGAEGAGRVDERQRPKKLPCGHVLHFSCLRSWLERQQVCPTCRRSVLVDTPSTNTRPNNQPNQADMGQWDRQAAGGIGLRGLAGNMANQRQPPAGIQGQPAQPQAPGRPGQQAGNQNRPAGNMRVFNFGPIRIALGNLRLPEQQQGNANNNAAANLAEQLVQNQQQQQVQNQAAPQVQAIYPLAPTPAATYYNPADIQSDILRIQQNILDSVRQLNAQHDQLDHVHALLGELNRLQQASGASGQGLPPITPLNANYGPWPMHPQAFFARGPVVRQGDPGLPTGLHLPEGWTLTPMHSTSNVTAPQLNDNRDGGQQSSAPQAAAPSTNNPLATDSPRERPSSSGAPGASNSSAGPSSAGPFSAGPSSKPGEPSSLESSWSFGQVERNNDAEGSSSAVASSSTEGQNLTRRAAMVEDTEDSGQ